MPLFFSLRIADFDNIFFFSNFLAKKAGFKEKKWFFAKWSGGGGVSFPTPLVVRPLKKTFFNVCYKCIGIELDLFP